MRFWPVFCLLIFIAVGFSSGNQAIAAPAGPAATLSPVQDAEHDHDHGEADNSSAAMWVLAGYSLLIIFASMLGGWLPTLIRLTHTRMQMLMSVVGGLMLGIGLFHLLPHGLMEVQEAERAGAVKGAIDYGIWWMVVGVVTMFLLIRMFHFHSHDVPDPEHDHDCDKVHGHDHDHDSAHSHGHHHHGSGSHELSWMGVFLGLSLHTMIDGLALGASIQADAAHGAGWGLFGLGTFVAIALHKPLDAVSITTLMKSGGWSASAMNLVNAAFAMMCPLGALLFVFGLSRISGNQALLIGCALTFSAGVFLCISLGDLLPEMEFHSHNRLKLTGLLLGGLALAYGIRYLEPSHQHGGASVEQSEPHNHDHDHGHEH